MIKTTGWILLFIAGYAVLRSNSVGIIPDWFNLSWFDRAGDYFQLILTAVATIIGIIITVTLLTFQLLAKENPLRQKKHNLLNDNYIVFGISLPASILILSLFSFVTIKKFDQNNTLTIGYYIGLMFVAFILSLFPAIKRILSISDTLENTLQEINNITFKNIQEILPLKNDRFVAKENNILLVKIRNRLISYAQENDYETCNAVLQSLNAKLRQLIGNGEDRKLTGEVFQALKFIIDPGIVEASRVSNYQYFITVWECIDEFYEYAAKNGIPLLNFEYLSSFVDQYISFLINNKLSDALRKASEVTINAFEINLKYNCPRQENIIDLYWAYDEDNAANIQQNQDEGMQWNKLEEIFLDFVNIYLKSVELKDKELYQSCYWETHHFLTDIKYGDLNGLQPFLERRVIENIFSLKSEAAQLANKENLFDNFGWTFHMDEFSINEFIKSQKSYVKFILERTGDFLIRSQKLEKINDDSLNNLGGIARVSCSEYKTNETAKNSVNYILQIFLYLKKIIEDGQLPGQANNYNTIKQQIESIKFYLFKNYPNTRMKLLHEIEKHIASFKEVKGDPDFIVFDWEEDE